MSWLPEERFPYSWWQSILIKILRCGSLPSHVAFIMDGNRRFAKQNQLETIEGHIQGFEKLAQTLQWCHDLGINQVTVYAFSIENYKRPKAEVDTLMNLARDKFRRLIGEADRFAEAGVRVKVLGNVSLLPQDLRDLIDEATRLTAANTKAVLNIAFSYTSRDEMTWAVKRLSRAVKQGHILESDISPSLIERCLYTCDSRVSPDGASSHSPLPNSSHSPSSSFPDLLVRTSGEVRLSDFLLWQSSYSVTHFTQVLWPEFSLNNLLAAVFHYQSKQLHIQELFQYAKPDYVSSQTEVVCHEDKGKLERISNFMLVLEKEAAATSKHSLLTTKLNNNKHTTRTALSTESCHITENCQSLAS